MIKNKLNKIIDDKTPLVMIIKKHEDIDKVIEKLRQHQPIIVNVSMLEKNSRIHTIYFLSGFCFALSGTFNKIDDYIFKIYV